MADASSSKISPAATRCNANRTIIDDAGVFLIELGVNATYFEESVYLPLGYTNAIYASLLRPFSGARDLTHCEQLMQVGISNKFFSTYRSMKMDEFTRYLHFLRSPAGQEALSMMAQRDRLARRGAKEIGRISMFEAQISDMSNEINDYRRSEDAEAARLEAELREVRLRSIINIEAIRQRFRPAGAYLPMTNPDLNRACWKAYKAATTAQKKIPVALTEASLIEAVKTYSDVVRHRHMLDFLKTDGFEDRLNEYIAEKVGQFDEAREERAAKRFRGLLEVVGANVPATIPSQRKGGPCTGGTGSSAEGEAQAEYRARLRASTIQHGYAKKPSKDRAGRGGKKTGL